MLIGSKLVIKTVNSIILGKVKTIPQPENTTHKTAYKLNKQNCLINWNESLNNIYNMVRGLNPYPAAWCLLKNNNEEFNVKIYNVEKCIEEHNFEIGKIISTKTEIKVAVNKGFIILKDIKMPGKRKMDVKSLLNGYVFDTEAKML